MERTNSKNNKPPDDFLYYPTDLLNKLFRRHGSDPAVLYLAYLHTARWQGTNRPKATNEYIRKVLKWGKARFQKAKNILEDLKLIKSIEIRNENGHIIAWYTQINHPVNHQSHSRDLMDQSVGKNQDQENHENQYVHQNPGLRVLDGKHSRYQGASESESGLESINTIKIQKNKNALNGSPKETSIKKEIKLLTCPNKMRFGQDFNDIDKRHSQICLPCPLSKECKEFYYGNTTWDGKHTFYKSKFIDDDGIRYYLCKDGRYRNKSGELYVE